MNEISNLNRKVEFRQVNDVIYAVDEEDRLLAKMYQNRDGSFVVTTAGEDVVRTHDFEKAKSEFIRLVKGE